MGSQGDFLTFMVSIRRALQKGPIERPAASFSKLKLQEYVGRLYPPNSVVNGTCPPKVPQRVNYQRYEAKSVRAANDLSR